MIFIDLTLRRCRPFRLPKRFTPPAAAAVIGLLAFPAMAQVNVFPGGGGVASSAQHTARVTLGQGIMGPAAGTAYSASVGFQSIQDWQVPTGSLPAASATAGAGALVTALIQDDGEVTAATLFYRVGGAVGFTPIALELTDASAGRWSAVIPAQHITSRGVQYYVTASDGIHVSYLPAGAPGVLANLSIALNNHPVFATTAGQYGMYSLPMAAADASPSVVFSQLGSYDPTKWRFGIYSAVDDGYREGAAAGSCSPGQGFWLITKNSQSITATGTTTPLTNSVTLALQPGFNQIANPYDFAINWSDVFADNNVENYLYGWNGTGYDSFSHTTMSPGRGYWVVANTKSAALTFRPLPADTDKSLPSLSPELLAADEEGWSINAVLTAGEFIDGNNRFGMRPLATSDRDAFDFLDAPPPPGEYAAISLLAGDGRRLLSDYRDPLSAGETWDLVLRSNQTGTPYRIDFRADRALPTGWQLVAIDPTGLDEVDLTSGGAVTGQVGAGEFARAWRLAAGDESYLAEARDQAATDYNLSVTSFALRPPCPNPFGSGQGTRIAFAAPRATVATLRVFDLRGRVVKTLHDGAVEQGVYRFDWNGSDDAGRRAAAGVYFLRLKTPETNLIRKVLYVR